MTSPMKAGTLLGEAMPSGMVQSFTDAEAYARFVPSTQVELTIATGGQFEAKATLIALHDLWMQRFSDNLPRVAHSVAKAGRAVISFRTAAGPSLVWVGLEMTPETILRHNEEFNSFQRSSGDAAWGSVSLPVSAIANIGSVMAGHDLGAPRNPVSVRPSPVAMWRLQRIHAEIGERAASAPELFAHAEATKGMEQALLEAMVSCLTASETHRETTGRGRHGPLIRKLSALLEASPDKPIYMPELSAALGVSGRTMRNCCQEHLGMPLNRYLTLRRMYLARRALEQADPAATRVTDVVVSGLHGALSRTTAVALRPGVRYGAEVGFDNEKVVTFKNGRYSSDPPSDRSNWDVSRARVCCWASANWRTSARSSAPKQR
jgi:AraC-like DNA-binding protein